MYYYFMSEYLKNMSSFICMPYHLIFYAYTQKSTEVSIFALMSPSTLNPPPPLKIVVPCAHM